MKPTMRDVAKLAGVSAMAVSSVLHGTGKNVRVSDETAKKIREAAHDLKYTPNSFARNLRSGKTHTVGVVFQHFQKLSENNPYYPQLLNGVMAALFPAEFTLALCPKLVRDGDIGAMLDGRFDGVLWARPDFTEANVETLRTGSVPLVMMHAPPGSAEGISTFCADNDLAMDLVVRHFAELGHQNCCFIVDQLNQHTSEGPYRNTAFKNASTKYGTTATHFVWDETTASLKEFRLQNPHITAIACFSDTLAGKLLISCNELDIAVPKDVSVVGFDSSSFCNSTTPRLTSIHQPVEKIAFEATSHLLSLIDDGWSASTKLPDSSTIYACGLDIRESTCPPSNPTLTSEKNTQ
jgi:LacI family transcriptional regulator